jgi:hypothetical protein
VKPSNGCEYKRSTLRWNERILKFEDEISVRGVDCNNPIKLLEAIIVRDVIRVKLMLNHCDKNTSVA